MQFHTCFICILLMIWISVSGVSALPGPDEWKQTNNSSFSSLTREEVESIISPVIGNDTYTGLVVVLVDPKGYQVYGYGVTDNLTGKIPDKYTIMGIGSVSKVVTGILIADAEERGIVNLSLPVSKYLPKVTIPSNNGREITLIDLVTHTSGLPSVPDTFKSAADNAWMNGDFDAYEEAFAYHSTMQADDIYPWLSCLTLSREPGSSWEYSNVGTGIAGNLVSRLQNSSYKNLLNTRILIPLSMNNTSIALSESQRELLAPGHRGYTGFMDEARFIEFNDFWAPSGGIYSTGEDMAVFLATNLGLIENPLDEAVNISRIPRAVRATEPILQEQAIFWDVLHVPDGSVMYVKSGETNGYQAHVILDPAHQTGVMIMANTAYLSDIHVEAQATALMKEIIKKNQIV